MYAMSADRKTIGHEMLMGCQRYEQHSSEKSNLRSGRPERFHLRRTSQVKHEMTGFRLHLKQLEFTFCLASVKIKSFLWRAQVDHKLQFRSLTIFRFVAFLFVSTCLSPASASLTEATEMWGPVSGNKLVRFTGLLTMVPADSVQYTTFACNFQGLPQKAAISDATQGTLSCLSPPAIVPSAKRLSISANGTLLIGEFTFNFYGISKLSPLSGFADGGVEVELLLSGYPLPASQVRPYILICAR